MHVDRSPNEARRPLCCRALLGIALAGAGLLACQRGADLGRAQPTAPEAEDDWLTRIGTGQDQTDRVCARGARDRIATVLCNDTTPPIHGLQDLYRALWEGRPGRRLVAATTHSLALSSRIVSAVNPRAFMFEDTGAVTRPMQYDRIAAVGFNRGEQLVELVGLDPSTYEYNFYVMRFEQECNRSRCTLEDLLTEKIERDWTDWTLYSDVDLEDTPLDCLSCHLPFGPGSHKLLLMRQVLDPWMHWGEFRGGNERFLCPVPPKDGGPGEVVVTADGLDALLALEGPRGHYAGIPVSELHAAKSGEVFVTFVADAEQYIRTSPYPHDYPYEQLLFQTREVVCERFYTGTSPTWDEERRVSLSKGLPVPFYGPDVLDPAGRAEILEDRTAFLERHAGQDAFGVLSSLMGTEIATAVGFFPRPEDTAPEILHALCIRCHANSTESRLRRSRFNAESVDRIEPAAFREIQRRLRLPKSSPELMPPRRVGELPPWAITRLEAYLSARCTEPGACRQ